MMIAWITRGGVKDGNDVNRYKTDVDAEFKDRELTTAEIERAEARKLNENQAIFQQQKDLYDQTHRLIAALERRLEVQSREAHEEREIMTREMNGLRRNVAALERRVSQLIFAFRAATGKEPPPPDIEKKDADSNPDPK